MEALIKHLEAKTESQAVILRDILAKLDFIEERLATLASKCNENVDIGDITICLQFTNDSALWKPTHGCNDIHSNYATMTVDVITIFYKHCRQAMHLFTPLQYLFECGFCVVLPLSLYCC